MLTRRQHYLLKVLRSGDHEAHARVRAAHLLERSGDPRFRADTWMLPDDPILGFVRIPAGPFLMGGKEPDDDPEDVASRCVLPDYYISRWPVTVAQYGVFHHDQGKARLGRYTSPGGSGQHHPVLYVTWLEAMDYCWWLEGQFRASTARLPQPLRSALTTMDRRGGWRIVLPSDAEWEKCARGHDERPYPWGFHFDEDCANVAQRTSSSDWYLEERVTHEVGDTSPVGCYPAGASPYGVEELLGNVEEWTRSTRVTYPVEGADSTADVFDGPPTDIADTYIIRGGAYDIDCSRVYERSGRRSMPFEDVGFRLAIVADD